MLKRIVVLGAGVSGLSTATLLLKQEKGIKVHLVAKHFPGDISGEYTSIWSGAYWRSYATKDDLALQGIDKDSFKYFWQLASAPQNEAGVMIINGIDYWEKDPQNDPWFKNFCPEFRYLEQEELPSGIERGATYKTVSINPSVYLDYLLKTFISLGGTTQRANLSHINDCISNDTDIVINCSGVHARTLGGVQDPDVYAARGQTVVVQLPQNHVNWAFLRHPPGSDTGRPVDKSIEMTYVIPHQDGSVVLGGTYDLHQYSTDVDHDAATRIVQRCLATRPDLLPQGQAQLTIKRHGVGLRPVRKGGPRIEAEWITENSGKKTLLCHNYGHGGAGFQSSYGSSQLLIKVMKEAMNL